MLDGLVYTLRVNQLQPLYKYASPNPKLPCELRNPEASETDPMLTLNLEKDYTITRCIK